MNELESKLLNQCGSEVEDLSILAAMMESCAEEKSGRRFFRSVISKRLSDATQELHKLLFHSPDAHQIEQAASWYGKGREKEALTLFERILKGDPTNVVVHSRLRKIIYEGGKSSERALQIRTRYYLSHLRSFGQGTLRSPFDVLFSEELIWVTDPVADKIFLFDLSGKLLRESCFKLSSPMGLFKDLQGGVRVCDFHNCRILAVDRNLEITEEIRLYDFAPHASPFLHPRFGCSTGETFVLLLMDKQGVGRRIVIMETSTHRIMESFSPPSQCATPIGLESDQHRIYVGDFDPAQIFEANPPDFVLGPCLKQHLPGHLRRFVKTADAFYITTGEWITKISLKGEVEYVFDLGRFFRSERVFARGLEVCRSSGKHLLLIADEAQSAIHCFCTDPSSEYEPMLASPPQTPNPPQGTL